MPVDYPHAADHIITNRSNFTVPASPRKIDRIIIHVAVGSYAGSLNWAQINPNGDSFHYIAGRSGAIAQAVREANIAHQAGYWPMNVRSVGIEHADLQQWASADWWTDDQIEASAKLTAYLCRKYRIPADRKHILAHNEVPTVTRPCPGPHFPWALLMRLVREELRPEPPKVQPQTLYRPRSGLFSEHTYADALVVEQKAKGLVSGFEPHGRYWAVYNGAFEEIEGAKRRLTEVRRAGYDEAFIETVEKS